MSRREARISGLLASGAALPALICAAALPAQAQTAPASSAQVSEIIVTATKQKQDIDKVPISISALGQAKMDVQGLRTLGDVVRQVPGVDITSASPTGATVAIRGIASNTGASTTGIYIDDIPIQSRATQENFAGTAFPAVFDLDRVEVLRGPQGTLWGAGAEGGAIRFITPEPSLTRFQAYGRAELSGTRYGDPSYEAGAAVGGRIVEDRLGFRISAWGRRDGGYVDRVSEETGERSPNSNYMDTVVSHAALLWRPTSAVTVTPSIFFQHSFVNDTSQVWPSLSDLGAGRYVNGHVIAQPTKDDYYLPALKVQVELGPVDFTSITSYFVRDQTQTGDYTNFESVIWTGLPNPILPGQNAPAFTGTQQRIPSQELRLQSHDPNARLRWTLGAFYSDAKEYDFNRVEDIYLDQLLLQTLGLNVEQLFGIPLTEDKYTFIGTTRAHDRQIAGFGQIDYRLFDRLTLTAGLRVARTKFSFVQYYAGPVNYSGSGPDGQTITGDHGETPVTPKVGLNYQLNPSTMLYFSAGKGYRIGGANTPVPLNPACRSDLAKLGLTSTPVAYDSDSTWSYEGGLKSRSRDGKLQVEASGFHIDWNKIQQYVGLPNCGGIGFTANLGDATVNGFDLQLSLRPVEQLLLSASVGYTDAKYATTVGSNGTIVVEKGDAVPGITPWTLAVAAEYHFAPSSPQDPYIRIDDTYRSHNSGRSANLDNPAALGYDPTIPFDPATNVVNVRAGLNFRGANFSLFVDNLLNAHPLLAKSHDTPTSPLYYNFTFRPLTAGATLIYRY